MNQIKTIVIDNGTGYTKMGPAGNLEPTHNIPTVIADRLEKVQRKNFLIYFNPFKFNRDPCKSAKCRTTI